MVKRDYEDLSIHLYIYIERGGGGGIYVWIQQGVNPPTGIVSQDLPDALAPGVELAPLSVPSNDDEPKVTLLKL